MSSGRRSCSYSAAFLASRIHVVVDRSRERDGPSHEVIAEAYLPNVEVDTATRGRSDVGLGARLTGVTSTYETLLSRLQVAFDALESGADPVLRASDRSDYQANGVMGLAKRLGRVPREVAEVIVGAARLEDVADVEIAGPGFLNLTLRGSGGDPQTSDHRLLRAERGEGDARWAPSIHRDWRRAGTNEPFRRQRRHCT